MRTSDRLRPYVPGFVVDWLGQQPHRRHRTVDGSLAFVDVSGFTRLTERLARRGNVGAEEMTGLLDATFAELLGVAYSYGAWLVKWGGDAVLLLFQGDGHAARACTAAVEMRRAMDVVGRLRTSSGPVRLRVSTGVHTGTFDLFLVGSTHRELVICGPGATTTALLEAAASAGQVAVSAETAAALPAGCVRAREDGLLLVRRSPGAAGGYPLRAPAVGAVDLGSCLPALSREHLLSGSDDAEHRLVTVAFVEFGGTDSLLAEQGPGAVTAAVDGVVRTCQEAAVTHGVTFWETDISKDGGKVMLVGGAPGGTGADEDAVLAVARAAVAWQGPLSVRAGVNSGRVFFGQFGPPYRRTMSVKGDAVNLAARLMGRAAPGEVLASSATLAAARTTFELRELPPFLVKGKTQPVSAAAVGAPRAAAAAPADGAPLVGRERELERLGAAWDRARRDGLQVVTVVAEPGMGRSRLVDALATRVDGVVVRLLCDPYTATSAYLPLARSLRGLLGIPDGGGRDALRPAVVDVAPDLLPWLPLVGAVVGIDTEPTPEVAALDERFRVARQHEVVGDLLRRLLPGPTLLVVDDAHLLDASSAALLDHLPGRCADAPWLVLLSRRSGETATGSGETVELGALPPAAALELLHVLTEDHPLPSHEAAALVQRAGGNPLFLAELAAGPRGVDGLPDSVEAVVAARIDRLAPRDRRLLRAAAVLGTEVEHAVLAAVAARIGERADAGLLRRLDGLLVGAGEGRSRFRQALVQETAYEGLPYSRRAELHGHVGDVLVERLESRADEHADVLSLHFHRAQRYEPAWRWARLAADRARRASAHAEAAQLYLRAIEAGRALGRADAELAEVVEALGDARIGLGQFAAAASAYDDARPLLRGRDVDTARVLRRSALCAERTGSYRAALRLLTTGDRALAGVGGPAAVRARAELAVARATVRHWQGRHADAVRECQRALPLARDVGADDVVAEALVWLDVSELMLGRGDGSHARAAYDLLVARRDRPWLLGRCLNELGIRAYFAGSWDESARCYAACRAAFAQAGDAWAALMAQANEAEVLCDQGRVDEAVPLLTEALRGSRAAEAPGFTAFVLSLLGRAAARSGRPAEAQDHLSAARRQHAAIGEVEEVVAVDARLAEAALLAGDAAGALAAADAVDVDHPAAAAVTPLLLRVRGLALARLGRTSEAVAALEESLSVARSRGARHEIAFALDALRSVAGLPPVLEAERLALLTGLGAVERAQPLAIPRPRAPQPVPVADR